MKDPGQRRRFSITDFILLVLLIGLIYVIYTMLGGDLSVLTKLADPTRGAGPVERMLNSLHSLGEGISNAFSSMLR